MVLALGLHVRRWQRRGRAGIRKCYSNLNHYQFPIGGLAPSSPILLLLHALFRSGESSPYHASVHGL
jgi:hypothetical protein